MFYLILVVLILLLIFGPQWWVKYTLQKYQIELASLPGTGAELAEHLNQRFGLGIKLEESETGDYYDSINKTVALSPAHFKGKSLSAVAVAAHEVGHAIQDQEAMASFHWRFRLAKLTQLLEKSAVFAIMIMPFVGGVFRLPYLSSLMMLFALSQFLMVVLLHLVTLPVEWDASFNKALPILQKGGYINPQEVPIVKKILFAAALTYVASALAGILNFWRWVAILKR